jgi:hypothetical protein
MEKVRRQCVPFIEADHMQSMWWVYTYTILNNNFLQENNKTQKQKQIPPPHFKFDYYNIETLVPFIFRLFFLPIVINALYIFNQFEFHFEKMTSFDLLLNSIQ